MASICTLLAHRTSPEIKIVDVGNPTQEGASASQTV